MERKGRKERKEKKRKKRKEKKKEKRREKSPCAQIMATKMDKFSWIGGF